MLGDGRGARNSNERNRHVARFRCIYTQDNRPQYLIFEVVPPRRTRPFVELTLGFPESVPETPKSVPQRVVFYVGSVA